MTRPELVSDPELLAFGYHGEKGRHFDITCYRIRGIACRKILIFTQVSFIPFVAEKSLGRIYLAFFCFEPSKFDIGHNLFIVMSWFILCANILYLCNNYF